MGRHKECMATKIDKAIKESGDNSIKREGTSVICVKCGDPIK